MASKWRIWVSVVAVVVVLNLFVAWTMLGTGEEQETSGGDRVILAEQRTEVARLKAALEDARRQLRDMDECNFELEERRRQEQRREVSPPALHERERATEESHCPEVTTASTTPYGIAVADVPLLPPYPTCAGCSLPMERRLILVLGIEGSGTKMMTGLVASGGAQEIHQPYQRLPDKDLPFSAASWMQSGPYLEELQQAQTYFGRALVELKRDRPTQKTFVYHRSVPDFDEFHFPDLLDEEMWRIAASAGFEYRVVVMYRQPPASTMSAVRRNFLHLQNLRQIRDNFALPEVREAQDFPPSDFDLKERDRKANVRYSSREVASNLAHLSRALQATHVSRWRVIGYEAFVSDPEPWVRMLATYLDMSFDRLMAAVNVKPAFSWELDASPDQVHYLRDYFTDERAAHQWPLLHELRLHPQPEEELIARTPPMAPIDPLQDLLVSMHGRFSSTPYCGDWMGPYRRFHAEQLSRGGEGFYILVQPPPSRDLPSLLATLSSALAVAIAEERALLLDPEAAAMLQGLEEQQILWSSPVPRDVFAKAEAVGRQESYTNRQLKSQLWLVSEPLLFSSSAADKRRRSAIPRQMTEPSFNMWLGCAFHFLFKPSANIAEALDANWRRLSAGCPKTSCLRVTAGGRRPHGPVSTASNCASSVATKMRLTSVMWVEDSSTHDSLTLEEAQTYELLASQQADVVLAGTVRDGGFLAAASFNAMLLSDEYCGILYSESDQEALQLLQSHPREENAVYKGMGR